MYSRDIYIEKWLIMIYTEENYCRQCVNLIIKYMGRKNEMRKKKKVKWNELLLENIYVWFVDIFL